MSKEPKVSKHKITRIQKNTKIRLLFVNYFQLLSFLPPYAEPETNDVAQNEEIGKVEGEQEEAEVEESSRNEIVLGEPINVGDTK